MFAPDLPPANPVVADMKGATIRAVFYRPYQRPAIIKEGEITDLKTYKNILFMFVVPEKGDAKWVSEFDFIAYIPQTVANKKATAA